jgi:glycosyltransferase involved in cell wall biosynthesis|tara:strand:- start:1521 stop:2210 length:690 start_codon:yes stop_codon:yes gene_type:complete
MKLSIVIPCFNEALNLPSLIKKCDQLKELPHVEIIFVDNGSSDNSNAVLKQFLDGISNFYLVSLSENQGYGYGILNGLRKASGDILAWTHADMQTDPNDLLTGFEIFNANNNKNIFVKGRRKNRPLKDNIFTFGMSVFASVLFRKIMTDINAQPTMFTREFFNSWNNPPNDFSLDLYAFHRAKKNDLKILRFPVIFHNRYLGNSSWNIGFQSRYNFIKRTIRYILKLKQ